MNLKQKIDTLKTQGYEIDKVKLEVGYEGDIKIAWGGHKNVSKEFKKKVIAICKRLEINPDYLMSCMALETIRTFSPSIKNPLATATGLIQFLESTAKKLGTSTGELAKMTQVEQLDYVEKYFQAYKGKIKNIEDIYMVIFYPIAVGKPNDYIISTKGNVVYDKNKGLDINKDGILTKGEAGAVARQYLKEGLEKYKG
ncbi:lytic transglycosylase [Helicobacter japonicus]|uniref:Lytic transglycosylase n=1 Tax=Helicobacter japonicus TaxID=425400 RepID=A0A4U8TG68_9HELI|nr:lytic transglycosylase [Helicobacter japonicus]